jgi:glycogen(starch) synthase
MHIVYVSKWFPPEGGGIATYVHNMYCELLRLGHKVTVLTSDLHGGNGFPEVYQIPFPTGLKGISRVPKLWRRTKALSNLVYSYRVARALRSLKDDVDLIEFVDTDSEGFVYALGRRRKPYVLYLHFPAAMAKLHYQTEIDPWLVGMERTVRRRADLVTSPSLRLARELEHIENMPSRPTEVIPYPVATSRFQSVDVGQRRNRDEVALLFAATLVREKGVFILLEAMRQVVKQTPNVHLTIMGRDHRILDVMSSTLIRKEIAESGLSEAVTLSPAAPHERLPEFIQACDVFVMPSFYETFSNVVLEAQACGKPVITTEVGGLPENIEDGVTGLLVKARDSVSLAQAIVGLVRDRNRRLEMGARAAERARGFFDLSKIAQERVAAYQRILAMKSPISRVHSTMS